MKISNILLWVLIIIRTLIDNTENKVLLVSSEKYVKTSKSHSSQVTSGNEF